MTDETEERVGLQPSSPGLSDGERAGVHNASSQQLEERRKQSEDRQRERASFLEEANREEEDSSTEEMAERKAPSSQSPRDAAVLEKVQAKLKKQLLDKKQELDERLYEQNVNLKKATKDREESGVQLYDLQCNLASLHLSLHKATSDLQTAAEQHAKAQEDLDHQQTIHTGRSTERKTLKEKMEGARLELDNLSNTLKQVEGFNEKIKGEIAMSRRATYAGEEAVVRAEKEKKEQDYLIDLLQQRIKHLYEKQASVKLNLQERETKVAHVALAEAGIEMETINAEKKQVTFQWKSSLIVLGRCDEALQALIDAIASQKEQKIAVEGEKDSYRKVIAVEQEKAERQGITLMKIDSAMKEVQKRIQRTIKTRMKMLEQFAKILVQVEEVESNTEKVKAELVALEFQTKIINQAFLKETRKIQELENKILQGLLEQITLEKKSAQATVASTMELRQLVKKEDTMATEINFNLARIRVDLLAVKSYNQSVTAALKAVDDDVKEKFLHISKLQTEIKRRHQEVEMKTKEIDRLNKQYDKLTSGLADKATTPWEAMINSLKTEIDLKLKASSELQKQWLQLQTALVGLMTENNNLTEKSQRMSAERVVLVQRKQRVDSQFNMLTRCIKEFNMGIRVKQGLIIRLNDLIGKNASLEEALSKENANLQIDHYLALKDLARDTMQMQVELEERHQERDYALRHVSELEHHVMLWKYKITFEIQTQAAIDPNVGQAVITAMKKELDRLQLRHDGLILQRKKLIAGLESRVDNRKAISVKVQAMSHRKGVDGPAGAEAGLVKACANLKKAIRDTDNNSVAIDQHLKELEESRGTLAARVTDTDKSITAILEQQEMLRSRLREVVNAKSRELLATAMKQRMVRRHEDVRSNKWKGVTLKQSLEAEVQEAQRKCSTLAALINSFLRDLPALQQKLDVMTVQLELALKIPH